MYIFCCIQKMWGIIGGAVQRVCATYRTATWPAMFCLPPSTPRGKHLGFLQPLQICFVSFHLREGIIVSIL